MRNSVINTYLIKEFMLSTLFNFFLIFFSRRVNNNLVKKSLIFSDYDVGIILPLALSFMIVPSILINIFPFIIFLSSMWF